MSIIDQKAFLKSIHPFDELTNSELDWLIKRIDIAFFPKDNIILKKDSTTLSLYVIIKGEVVAKEENNSDKMFYHPKDSFDSEALIDGVSKYNYIAIEDTIVYEIKKDTFLKLFKQNNAFREFYTLSIVQRIEYLKQKEQNISNFFLTSKVGDSYIHKACIVDVNTSLKEAIAKSIELNRSEIIIKKENNYGIVTNSDIKKLLLTPINLSTPIGDIAKFSLISIQKNDFLFNAYLSLIQNNIKRLVVFEEEKLIGIIEQIDILSFFANKSHLLTLKIQKAQTLEELKRVSNEYLDIVKRLFEQGVKSRYIAKLISEINRKLLLKVFEFIIPKELQEGSAFIVMGSEGRKEQIIKTDQDNALIVSNNKDLKKYAPYMKQIGKTLIELGYPPCPGNMMVTNPFWQDNINGYKEKINKWLSSFQEEHFIKLATFFDAVTIAGDNSLLNELKDYIFENINRQNSLYLANFAKLSLRFNTPVGFFSSLFKKDKIIDIKKAGIFPIVQGIRAYALKYKINKHSTINRLKKLANKEVLELEFAKEIAQAFEALSYLRLKSHLEAIKANKEVNNKINTTLLTKIDRDILKDSLVIVDRFKKIIIKEFELEMLPQ